VVHAMPPELGTSLSDWVRRSGVAVAIIGTAVAAPEGTALIWRWIKGALGRARSWLASTWLVSVLPFLRKNATVHGVTAHLRAEAMFGAVATSAPGWDATASLEGKVHRLHDQMQWVFAEIEKARQKPGIAPPGCARRWSSRRMNCGLSSRLTRQRTWRRSARPRRWMLAV
jgi:hypothetical protein